MTIIFLLAYSIGCVYTFKLQVIFTAKNFSCSGWTGFDTVFTLFFGLVWPISMWFFFDYSRCKFKFKTITLFPFKRWFEENRVK